MTLQHSLPVQVIDAQYAFVLHTANPLTGRQGDFFGELVPGLGEVLVSTAYQLCTGCHCSGGCAPCL